MSEPNWKKNLPRTGDVGGIFIPQPHLETVDPASAIRRNHAAN
jgi:hypothetical protein